MDIENVLELRPTHLALGFDEIRHKVKPLRSLSKKKRAGCLHEYTVPIVILPLGHKFLIDPHRGMADDTYQSLAWAHPCETSSREKENASGARPPELIVRPK